SPVRSANRLIISWVTSTGSLHSLNASVIFPLSCAMSSKRISSTVVPPRASTPAVRRGRPDPYLARAGHGRPAALARPPTLRYREAGMTPERTRVLNVLFHLPNFIRLYWRLLRDRRVSVWPKAL